MPTLNGHHLLASRQFNGQLQPLNNMISFILLSPQFIQDGDIYAGLTFLHNIHIFKNWPNYEKTHNRSASVTSKYKLQFLH